MEFLEDIHLVNDFNWLVWILLFFIKISFDEGILREVFYFIIIIYRITKT
jgi:hypothetical protein